MPRFKALIADDERLSRQRIRRLLAMEPEWELIGECATGAEALRVLERDKPDILFLDIQMPEMDGFEVIAALETRQPLIILTSAYDEYALRAFDVHAFDYLLKPFDRRRFRLSVRRARDYLAQGRSGPPHHTYAAKAPDRVAVRNNGRLVFLKVRDIDWIEASDNYVCLHCGKETHVLRETMSEIERRLDPSFFIRVHRSAIVNLDRIRELQPWFRGDYRIVLNDGTELSLTRAHREKLESQLLMG